MQAVQLIQTDQILQDKLFETRFLRDDRSLESSIKTFGVLNPLLLAKTNGKLQVADGQARLALARNNNITALPCVIIDSTEISLPELFAFSLEYNRWSRGFNLVEKALCFKQACAIYQAPGKIPQRFFDTIEIKNNIRTIYQYKELLQLSPLILKHTINNNLPLPVVLLFLKFPPEERDKIAQKLFVLPINQNKLAEILAHLSDIARRDNLVASVLIDNLISQTAKRDSSAVEKAQNLRLALQKMKHPHYEKTLSQFEAALKKIPLQDNIKIIPAPFFEEDYLEIKVKIESEDDISTLQQLLTDKALPSLFKLNK